MKFLLVLTVVAVAVWLWRNNRRSDAAPPRRAPPPHLPLRMVACLHCGTHLPETEAVRGAVGVYCSADHRQQHEQRPA